MIQGWWQEKSLAFKVSNKNKNLAKALMKSSWQTVTNDKDNKGKVKKKNIKKLTNVSLYVCMSAENSKMLVFVCFFNVFSNCRLRKKHKMLVFMECVCM